MATTWENPRFQDQLRTAVGNGTYVYTSCDNCLVISVVPDDAKTDENRKNNIDIENKKYARHHTTKLDVRWIISKYFSNEDCSSVTKDGITYKIGETTTVNALPNNTTHPGQTCNYCVSGINLSVNTSSYRCNYIPPCCLAYRNDAKTAFFDEEPVAFKNFSHPHGRRSDGIMHKCALKMNKHNDYDESGDVIWDNREEDWGKFMSANRGLKRY
jgi:hypothetical protein